jgi:hypothetical protein
MLHVFLSLVIPTHCMSCQLTPTIGLGRAQAVTAVEITWPGPGPRQTVPGLPLDCAVEITEGRDGYRILDWPRIATPDGPPVATITTQGPR